MQNSEGGRKLNQAMVSTSRAVATTGKAVGKYDNSCEQSACRIIQLNYSALPSSLQHCSGLAIRQAVTLPEVVAIL